MIIKSIKGSNKLNQTSYLLIEDKQAILIDCGFDFAVVDDYLKSNNITLLAVFLTHGHFDHALQGAKLLSLGYRVFGSTYIDELTNSGKDLGRFLGVPFTKFTTPDKLANGNIVKVGPFEVGAIYTPGHTIDGMCYLINGVLFSGDTLLSGAYGRVDLPTANPVDMRQSLKRLFTMDKKIPVCSGHERVSSGVEAYFPNRTIGDYACSQDIIYFLTFDNN